MKCFKRITNMAPAKEWMRKDPFYGYKMAQDETDPVFLTYPELKSIMEKEFTIPGWHWYATSLSLPPSPGWPSPMCPH